MRMHGSRGKPGGQQVFSKTHSGLEFLVVDKASQLIALREHFLCVSNMGNPKIVST
jgi:hypothetical protein